MVESGRSRIRSQGEVTPDAWAAVVVGAITTITAVYSVMRYMVKSIMREFSPNGGSSLKDQVNRIEMRLDALYQKLLD
jgi:hypothetical protein